MDAVLKSAQPDRRNPYLDWEFKNRLRRIGEPENWCPVQVQVLPTQAGDYVPNLRRLAAAAFAGRQDDDPGGADVLGIRMAGDEQQHLMKLLEEIDAKRQDPPTDPVDSQFFIYRPESLANRQFNSGVGDIYRIIDVGPPIIGLKLNPAGGNPDPTSFGHDLAATTGHVAIGIIDDGIAFAHERFRDGNEKSRIQALWLQDIERANHERGVVFGRRLDNGEINFLLKHCGSEAEIYRCVGLLDFGSDGSKSLASRRSHGTHILDLAGGFDPDPQQDAVKRRRPLLAVQLPSAVTVDTSGVMMGSYVLQAVRQIMLWADRISPILPLVINFSYGIQAGPKDGMHRIERSLTQLIDRRNKRGAPTCLVLPAGNSYRTRTTANMKLGSNARESIYWVMLPDDGTPNHLEIWLDGAAIEGQLEAIEIGLTPPSGEAVAVHGLKDGEMRTLEVDGLPIAGIYCNLMPGADGAVRGRLHIAVNSTVPRLEGGAQPAPAGRWGLTLLNKSEQGISAHLYIQRDDTPMEYPRRGRQSFFDHDEAYARIPLDGSYRKLNTEAGCPITSGDTLSAIATGAGTVVVGAAFASDQVVPANYTSSGPVISRGGPDCSAIADQGNAHWGVLAAGSYSGSVVAMRGTSVAAPQLVRKIADYLATLSGGPVLFSSGSVSTAAAGHSSNAAALRSITEDPGVATPASDPARLGSFVLREPTASHIPRRKY
ncbi:MAG: hypothetical protein PS018_23265 [bacterium]|nr:hypothetical protein [bacterium]